MFTFQFPNFDELIYLNVYMLLCISMQYNFSYIFGPVNNIEKLFLIYLSLDLCSVAPFYICFVVLISLNSSCV